MWAYASTLDIAYILLYVGHAFQYVWPDGRSARRDFATENVREKKNENGLRIF